MEKKFVNAAEAILSYMSRDRWVMAIDMESNEIFDFGDLTISDWYNNKLLKYIVGDSEVPKCKTDPRVNCAPWCAEVQPPVETNN